MWVISRIALLCVCLTFQFLVGFFGSASASPQVTRRTSVTSRQASLYPFVTTLNASSGDIEAARQIVQDAIAKMTELNKARLAKPNRDNFRLKRGTKTSKRDNGTGPKLLEITDEMARAAALLAELGVDPVSNSTFRTPTSIEKRAGTFWMESIAHKGTVAWGNDASYKVVIIGVST